MSFSQLPGADEGGQSVAVDVEVGRIGIGVVGVSCLMRSLGREVFLGTCKFPHRMMTSCTRELLPARLTESQLSSIT